ncbi:hypothetical protein [Halobaculum sp. MBLA0143]|uniref:hypothetical protein n=1 Tax=Halobaculum sp. MBLA0143 TaxID=3079933 RepID=UPI003524DF14
MTDLPLVPLLRQVNSELAFTAAIGFLLMIAGSRLSTGLLRILLVCSGLIVLLLSVVVMIVFKLDRESQANQTNRQPDD